jgi:hypothetical protein
MRCDASILKLKDIMSNPRNSIIDGYIFDDYSKRIRTMQKIPINKNVTLIHYEYQYYVNGGDHVCDVFGMSLRDIFSLNNKVQNIEYDPFDIYGIVTKSNQKDSNIKPLFYKKVETGWYAMYNTTNISLLKNVVDKNFYLENTGNYSIIFDYEHQDKNGVSKGYALNYVNNIIGKVSDVFIKNIISIFYDDDMYQWCQKTNDAVRNREVEENIVFQKPVPLVYILDTYYEYDDSAMRISKFIKNIKKMKDISNTYHVYTLESFTTLISEVGGAYHYAYPKYCHPSILVGAHFNIFNSSTFINTLNYLNKWFTYVYKFSKPIRSIKDNDKQIILPKNRKGEIIVKIDEYYRNEEEELDLEYAYKERSKKQPKSFTFVKHNFYKSQYNNFCNAKWRKTPHYNDDFPFQCRKVNTTQYIKYVSKNYKDQDKVDKILATDIDNIE